LARRRQKKRQNGKKPDPREREVEGTFLGEEKRTDNFDAPP
jgi:hypothetical protein